jgi:transcriptional regulator with XRE-family HTH domain
MRMHARARGDDDRPLSERSCTPSTTPLRSAQVIYGARKARNLRQTDLAELSGVTQADISRIERRQVAPTNADAPQAHGRTGVEIQCGLAESGTDPPESISLRAPAAG